MNHKTLVTTLVATACAGILAHPALAQTQSATVAGSGFYMGAALGTTKHNLKKSDFGPVGGIQARLDDSDRAGKVFGGYQFNPNVAIEAQYLDLGTSAAKYTSASTVSTKEYTVHAMSIAAVGSLPVSNDLSLFAKIGSAATTTKTRVNSTSLGVASTSKSTVLLVGVGATYQINDTLHLRAEYERLGQVGKASDTGRATPSALTVGLAYRF